MALTTAQQEQQADDDLDKKHALEAAFSLLLLKLFRRIARDASKNYRDNGGVVSAYSYRPDFNKLLLDIYNKTSAQFKDVLEKQLEAQPNQLAQLINSNQPLGAQQIDDIVEQLDQSAKQSIESFSIAQSTAASTQIIGTTQDDIDKSLSIAVAAGLSRVKTSSLLNSTLMQQFNSRASLIAADQVQNAAEGTKEIVANEFNQLVKRTTGKKNSLKKVWVTRGDDKVRQSHREANLQKVNFNDPFIVQGQRLMRPRDSSLGATPDNLIRCRCSSIPVLV